MEIFPIYYFEATLLTQQRINQPRKPKQSWKQLRKKEWKEKNKKGRSKERVRKMSYKNKWGSKGDTENKQIPIV